MRHIKILKKVAFAAATLTIAATPAIVTSCSCYQIDNKLNSILIDLPDENYEICAGQHFVSKNAIDVLCFNKSGQRIKSQTNLILTNENNLPTQSWIWIDRKNKINIQGDVEEGTYKFKVYAEGKTRKVKSKVKCFSVHIYHEKIVPENISIVQPEHTIMYFSQKTGTDLKLTASRYEYEEYQLDKRCDWSIENIDELPKDLDGRDLFHIEADDDKGKLFLSTKVDETFVGKYILNVKASCKQLSTVFDECSIQITVENGLYYKYDTEIYTRPTLNDDWEFTCLTQGTPYLNHVLEEINGIPVSKISDNFCFNSGMKELQYIELPPTIKTIGKLAFYNQQKLETVYCPNVTCIGDLAFYQCLKMDFNPGSVPKLEYIGNNAFQYCLELKEADLTNIRHIGDCAFAHANTVSFNVGNTVEYIGYNAFGENKSLETITINCIEPPELCGSLWNGWTIMSPTIYVPAQSLEIYRSRICWRNYDVLYEGF